jgi:hypothetical protein
VTAARVDGRREVVLGLVAYAAYLAVRHARWNDDGRARARANALRLQAIERRLHVDVEAAVQRVALRVPGAAAALNAGYAVGNVALSVGWLIALFRRGDPAYRRERRAALAAFTAALMVFAVLPVAPPRTLDGFVDTTGGERQGLDHPLLVKFFNPIAAMPSEHLAFATITGLGLAGRAGGRVAPLAWRCYPAAVGFVVVATANHFVVDVVAGAALGAVARRLTR